jgi:hypothetical protein
MTRILWIIGLSIALLVFSGFVITSLLALITHRHLNFTGWMMLVSNAIGVRFIFAGLRSAIRYGDPTKGVRPQSTN